MCLREKRWRNVIVQKNNEGSELEDTLSKGMNGFDVGLFEKVCDFMNICIFCRESLKK